MEHQDSTAATERSNLKSGAKTGEAVFSKWDWIFLGRCQWIWAKEFLLPCRWWWWVRQFGGDIPVSIVEHHFEGVSPLFAQQPNGCPIRIRNGISMLIHKRIGQIPIVDPTNVQLGGVSVVFKDLRQTYIRVVGAIQKRIILCVLIGDMVPKRIEGFLQEPFVDA